MPDPRREAAIDEIRAVLMRHADVIAGCNAVGEPLLGRWAVVTEWIDEEGTRKPVMTVLSPRTSPIWEIHGLLGWGQFITGQSSFAPDFD
jgi:hypothetical protein